MPYSLVHSVTQDAAAWRDRIGAALLTVETRLHQQQHEPPPPDLLALPERQEQLFRMLTWKVWCLRYRISPEFLLEFLIRCYHAHRRQQPGLLMIGLALTTATGPVCRQRLEEAVARTFPDANAPADGRQEPVPLSVYRDRDAYDMAMWDHHHHPLPKANLSVQRPWRRV